MKYIQELVCWLIVVSIIVGLVACILGLRVLWAEYIQGDWHCAFRHCIQVIQR